MNKKGSGKRAASVVGLVTASLFAAGNADAAQELGQLAAGDSRVLVIATLFVPIIGWVRSLWLVCVVETNHFLRIIYTQHMTCLRCGGLRRLFFNNAVVRSDHLISCMETLVLIPEYPGRPIFPSISNVQLTLCF